MTSNTRRRTRVKYPLMCVGGAMALALPLASPVVAAGPITVPVVNGDFALADYTIGAPAAVDGTVTVGWDGAGKIYGPAVAQHPDGAKRQAANLNDGGGAKSLSSRMWGVHTGDNVTVTFDDSPSAWTACEQRFLNGGQPYSVQAAGSPVQNMKTNAGTVGKVSWVLGRKYEFTATEDNPLLTFSANPTDTAGLTNCGPMLAKVAATKTTVPVKTDTKKDTLKLATAYLKNAKEDSINDAVTDCNAASNNCTYTAFPERTYPYYDKARVLGEVYINCTREDFQDVRNIIWDARTYDSISQWYADRNLPLDPPDDITRSKDKIAFQVGRGVEKLTNAAVKLKRSTNRWIAPTILPGEASWIEVQDARRHVEGVFTNMRGNERHLYADFDIPSATHSDRLYQRTGPMSAVEEARCDAARNSAITPDNTTNTQSTDLIIKVPATPGRAVARSVELATAKTD